jgi:hypothetical protein
MNAVVQVTRRVVVANVRPDGSVGAYEPRTFDFLLPAGRTPEQQQRQARRLIQSIGYQVRGVSPVTAALP